MILEGSKVTLKWTLKLAFKMILEGPKVTLKMDFKIGF
jgi:hypothetical protein